MNKDRYYKLYNFIIYKYIICIIILQLIVKLTIICVYVIIIVFDDIPLPAVMQQKHCLEIILCSTQPYKHGFTSLVLFYSLTGEESQDLGPPPSVDEAANTLMTRLGFLLGDKVNEGPGGAQYSMEEQDDPQV